MFKSLLPTCSCTQRCYLPACRCANTRLPKLCLHASLPTAADYIHDLSFLGEEDEEEEAPRRSKKRGKGNGVCLALPIGSCLVLA